MKSREPLINFDFFLARLFRYTIEPHVICPIARNISNLNPNNTEEVLQNSNSTLNLHPCLSTLSIWT